MEFNEYGSFVYFVLGTLLSYLISKYFSNKTSNEQDELYKVLLNESLKNRLEIQDLKDYQMNVNSKEIEEAIIELLNNDLTKDLINKSNYKQFDKILLEKISLVNNEIKKSLYYNALAKWYFINYNFDSAIDLLQKAIALDETNFTFLINLSKTHSFKTEYFEAIKIDKLALKVLYHYNKNDKNYLLIRSKIFSNIGLNFAHLDIHKKAMLYLKKSLKYFEKTKISDNLFKVKILTNIGTSYSSNRYYEKAIEYCEKALKYPLQEKYYMETYFELSLAYVEIEQYDKAEVYFQKSKILIENNIEYQHHLAALYLNIGLFYQKQGNFMVAREHYSNALNEAQKYFDKNNLIMGHIYSNIGSTYLNEGQWNDYKDYELLKLSEKYYKESLNILKHKLPSNHYNIEKVQEALNAIYFYLGRISKNTLMKIY